MVMGSSMPWVKTTLVKRLAAGFALSSLKLLEPQAVTNKKNKSLE